MCEDDSRIMIHNSRVMLQIMASLTDDSRGIIYKGTWAYRGQLWKGHQKNIFMTKLLSINKFFIVWTSLYCSKIQYLFNETNILVVNWPKWLCKFQHLFCGALYNQWKTCCSIEKCLNDTFSRFTLSVSYQKIQDLESYLIVSFH